MSESELPAEVRRLIVSSIPTLEALELLLLLARDPGREWQPAVIPRLLMPARATEEQVTGYLATLVDQGILRTAGPDRFVYEPRSPELVRTVEELIIAYHQRPVTLIRAVYASAEVRRIQSFADAFRLKREGE